MPKENIERAIRRGAGLEKGEALEEVTYEGYAPHGVALLIQVLTDNRNRAVADVRRIFARSGGNLGETGCVGWLFEQKGYITIPVNDDDPEELAMVAIDAGAEDITVGDDLVEVYARLDNFHEVRDALQRQGMTLESAELSMIPQTLATLGDKETLQVMGLIDALEELDDVQQVFSNLDISDEIMSRYEAA